MKPSPPRKLTLLVSRRADGDAEVMVNPAGYPDPRALAIVIAELPDHVANAYARSPEDRDTVRKELRRIILTEWKNPTGEAQALPSTTQKRERSRALLVLYLLGLPGGMVLAWASFNSFIGNGPPQFTTTESYALLFSAYCFALSLVHTLFLRKP